MNIVYSDMSLLTLSKLKKKAPTKLADRSKKKIDRFDGLTEEQVQNCTLPDYLDSNLDIIFIGINPSLMAAHRGRYYAGSGNHFYKLLYESELTPQCFTYEEDYKLLQHGIGLTNIVTRPTRSSADLKQTEIKQGSKIVKEKLKMYKPKIAVFNGKCIYKVFADKMVNFNFGLQLEHVGSTALWVMPSSSARCANFPKMTDKLHFFISLKKYLQFLKGEITDINKEEFLFEGRCKQFVPRTSKMWRRKNVSAFSHGGRIANENTISMDPLDENVAIAHSTEFLVKRLRAIESDTIIHMETSRNRYMSESCQDFEAIVPQNNVKTFFERKESSEIHVSVINDTARSNKCLAAFNSMKGEEKERDNKTVPQSLLRINNFEINTDSEFVNLIKERLARKVEKDSPNEEQSVCN